MIIKKTNNCLVLMGVELPEGVEVLPIPNAKDWIFHAHGKLSRGEMEFYSRSKKEIMYSRSSNSYDYTTLELDPEMNKIHLMTTPSYNHIWSIGFMMDSQEGKMLLELFTGVNNLFPQEVYSDC